MKRPEQSLHIATAGFLRAVLKPPTIWGTIGHGGGGKLRGAFLRAMGVQAGWPDLLIMDRIGGKLKLIGLELKSQDGRQSPEQKRFQQQLEEVGGIYGVCRSLDEVEGFLRGAGIQLHGVIGGRA